MRSPNGREAAMKHYAAVVAVLLIVAGVGFTLGETVRPSPPPAIELLGGKRAPEEVGTVRRRTSGGHRESRRRAVSRGSTSGARASRSRAATGRQARSRPATTPRAASEPSGDDAGVAGSGRDALEDDGDDRPSRPAPAHGDPDDDSGAGDDDTPAPAPAAEPLAPDDDRDEQGDPGGDDDDAADE